MFKKSIFILTSVLCFVGCQTPPKPKLVTKSTKKIKIENYEFVQTDGTDAKNANLRGIEIKPAVLPYTGDIANLTAQDRWMKMFEAAVNATAEGCKPLKVTSLNFSAAEMDYSKFGKDPKHPAYIQTIFDCQ